MAVDHRDEVLSQRTTVRDLLALSTIPEAWIGREPTSIAADLADLLIGSLELDFAFVRLCDPGGSQVVEVTRGDSWKAFPEWLQRHLAAFGQISRKETVANIGGVEKPCSGIVIPIGVNSERGLVAVASGRRGFPDQIDQQLLSVAAHNAATAFQNAFLIGELRNLEEALRDNERELRKGRDGLEIKVAERTSELSRSEKELRDDIEERKLAEEGLRQSEERFRLVLDSIGAHVIAMDLEGELEFANQPSLDYFGKTLEELKGWRTSDAVHPDDLASAIAVWRDSIEKGISYDVDYRLRRSDGVYRWFHVCGRPQRDAQGSITRWYALLTDIDERKKAEQKLEAQEMELRQVLDLSPQLIAVFGPHYRERIFINRIGLEYHGLTLDEWRNAAPGALGHPDDSKRVRAIWDRAISSGTAFESEGRLRKSDGSYRWFLIRYNPVRDEEGKVLRWYAASTDIDDRKRDEERLQQENVALREEIDRASMFEEIVGTSPALQAVLSRVSKVAPSDSTVLVMGETGTGKELVARAIHRRSRRAARAFVGVNCAAIPRDLIASELFGHERGAFTGAMQRRIGRFELAEGGTIFLDEVGELSAETQVALLRVLQEREFERVGGTQPIHIDVRVIAATNRDLKAAVASGTFRQDLYYRLNVFPLEVPPLRERRKDVPLLVQYFIDRYARKAGKNIKTVDKKTLELLQSYPWPGNIRELQNVIERSVIVCEAETFSVDESWLSQQPRDKRLRGKLLSEKLAAKEKEVIEEALRESQGRVSGPSGAAAKLGIARSTLEMKIRSLNINKNRFKARPGS